MRIPDDVETARELSLQINSLGSLFNEINNLAACK